MKKIIHKITHKPFLLPTISLVTFASLYFSLRNEWEFVGLLCILAIGFLGVSLAILSIYFFEIKQYRKTTLSCIQLVALFTITFLLLYNHYKAETIEISSEYKLPQNMEMDNIRPDSVVYAVHSSPDFEIYQSFDEGFYDYDIWLRNPKKGFYYLHIVPMNKQIDVYNANLFMSSRIHITEPGNGDTLKYLPAATHFVIKNNKPGIYFPAEVELWYLNESKTDSMLLLRKKYRLQGYVP